MVVNNVGGAVGGGVGGNVIGGVGGKVGRVVVANGVVVVAKLKWN